MFNLISLSNIVYLNILKQTAKAEFLNILDSSHLSNTIHSLLESIQIQESSHSDYSFKAFFHSISFSRVCLFKVPDVRWLQENIKS